MMRSLTLYSYCGLTIKSRAHFITLNHSPASRATSVPFKAIFYDIYSISEAISLFLFNQSIQLSLLLLLVSILNVSLYYFEITFLCLVKVFMQYELNILPMAFSQCERLPQRSLLENFLSPSNALIRISLWNFVREQKSSVVGYQEIDVTWIYTINCLSFSLSPIIVLLNLGPKNALALKPTLHTESIIQIGSKFSPTPTLLTPISLPRSPAPPSQQTLFRYSTHWAISGYRPTPSSKTITLSSPSIKFSSYQGTSLGLRSMRMGMVGQGQGQGSWEGRLEDGFGRGYFGVFLQSNQKSLQWVVRGSMGLLLFWAEIIGKLIINEYDYDYEK